MTLLIGHVLKPRTEQNEGVTSGEKPPKTREQSNLL